MGRGAVALLVAVAMGLAGVGTARGQGAEGAALRGLEAVAVVAGEVAPEAVAAGGGVGGLLAGVAERVRKAGLRVVESPETPRLAVGVEVFQLKAAGLYAFAVTLALEEPVTLARPPGAAVRARTWTSSAVGTSLSGRFGETLAGALERLADHFADAYLVENPPR